MLVFFLRVWHTCGCGGRSNIQNSAWWSAAGAGWLQVIDSAVTEL